MPEGKLIETDADYYAALVRIDALMDAKPNTPEFAELEVLSELVKQYEASEFDDARSPLRPSRTRGTGRG